MAEHVHPFGHESPAIAVRTVLRIGAIVAATVLIVLAVLYAIFRNDIAPGKVRARSTSASIPPAPRLQPHPGVDVANLRREKEALLSGYAWTDGAHTTARIPIERAMAIYAAQHANPQAPAASSPQQEALP